MSSVNDDEARAHASALLDAARAKIAALDPSSAIEAFDRAIELVPNDPAMRLEYANALVALGELDDAAYHLLQANKLRADDPVTLRALGEVFYRKGLHDKAVRFYGRATKVDPNDARAFYSLGVVHDARNDPGAAIAALREAIRLDPSFLDARRTLVDALAALGEHAQAIDAIDALLEVSPRDEQAAKNREVLAHALAEMSRHRLLGKHDEDLEKSALVAEGGMKKKGVEADGAVRFANKLADLYVAFAGDEIASMMLVLPDPKRATGKRDDVFGVTVVGKDGRRAPADYGTAITLTFLREAIGVPLTQAGVFYARLLAGEARVEFGGATARFSSRAGAKEGEERHGLLVEALPRVFVE